MKFVVFLVVGFIIFMIGGGIIEPDEPVEMAILFATSVAAGLSTVLFMYLGDIIAELRLANKISKSEIGEDSSSAG